MASATSASTSVKPLRPAGLSKCRVSRRGRGVPPAAPLSPHARPPLDAHGAARAKPQGVPRARAAHLQALEVLRVEVCKRSLPALDAVGTKGLQRVAAAVGQVDVDVPP